MPWLAGVRVAARLLPVAVQEGDARLADPRCGLAEAPNFHFVLAALRGHGWFGLRVVAVEDAVSLEIDDRLALRINMPLQVA